MNDRKPTDRKTLAASFDRVAGRYHQARPDYPEALYASLLETTQITQRARLLEIGCGTGIATLPFARRGFHVTCVEPGRALVEEARRNLKGFEVRLENVAFEDWRAPVAGFDLVFAATAWHWLDPTRRYELAARALRPAGFLAVWSAAHVFPTGGDPLFREIQQVYDAIDAGDETRWPAPGELPELSEEITASGKFEVVRVQHFDWETIHDAESYLDLLRTFSGHIEMAEPERQRLFDEIRQRVNNREDPRIRRHWGAVLHIARRLPE